MGDYAHEQVEERLKKIEKRIAKEYAQAEKAVGEKLDDYFRRFDIKDEKWKKWVEDGRKSQEDYLAWRKSQLLVGEKWKALKEQVAEDMHNANLIARNIMDGYTPEVYAINHNYATYQIEHDAKIDTSYTLFDEQSTERVYRDNPRMMPRPGKKKMKEIREGRDVLWNQEQVQSIALQSIIQGKAIPEITKDIEKTLGERNHKAAIRNARTMMTGAQNGGRVDAYRRARDMGVGLRQCWIATLDNRTRHAHRVLDGQTVEVGQPFEVEGEFIRFPGDPEAPGHLVYNCRCTLIAQISGFEIDTTSIRDDPDIGDMTYDEWKRSRKEKHNPITLPEEKARAIKASYIKEYKDG